MPKEIPYRRIILIIQYINLPFTNVTQVFFLDCGEITVSFHKAKIICPSKEGKTIFKWTISAKKECFHCIRGKQNMDVEFPPFSFSVIGEVG